MGFDFKTITPEQKKEAASQCGYFWLTIFSMTAWICGLTATAYCSFVKRNISFADDEVTQLCNEIGKAQCDSLLQNHGVGFYGWTAEVGYPPETQCLSYTQFIYNSTDAEDGGTYVTPWFDMNFNMALASTYIADIFGGVAFMIVSLALCCPISQKRLPMLSCCYFIACLFQGFTLLIFESNACGKGFFSDSYFKNVDFSAVNLESFEVSCSLNTGSKLAISATVFYFLCMIGVHKVVVPKVIGLEFGGGDEEQDEEKDAEIAEEQALPEEKAAETPETPSKSVE